MSRDVKIARWVATIAGLIGFVLSVATPLLPVVQTTATLNWPQGGQLNGVTAPLISQVPVTMTVTVPCDVIRSMPPAGNWTFSKPRGLRLRRWSSLMKLNLNRPGSICPIRR